MRHIFILTQYEDVHAEAVKSEINRKGGQAILLMREDYGTLWTVSAVELDTFSFFVTYKGENFRINDDSVFYIRRDFTTESQSSMVEIDESYRSYVGGQRAIHVNSFLEAVSHAAKFLNTPRANRRAASKMHQLQVAAKIGLSIPRSFIGGSSDIAGDFLEVDQNPLIIKPLEAVHVKSAEQTYAHYTAPFIRRPRTELASLAQCPVILQNCIEKRLEYRVTVVGKQIFACSIDTANASADAKHDWRHFEWENTPHFKADAPDDVKGKILRVMNEFGLGYAAFDFIERPDGEWVFLELNSMGQWLWIEDLTELPITAAIAEHLLCTL